MKKGLLQEFKSLSKFAKLNVASDLLSIFGISVITLLQIFLYKNISSFVMTTANLFIAIGGILFLIFCATTFLYFIFSFKKHLTSIGFPSSIYYIFFIAILLVVMGMLIIFGYKILTDIGFSRIS